MRMYGFGRSAAKGLRYGNFEPEQKIAFRPQSCAINHSFYLRNNNRHHGFSTSL